MKAASNITNPSDAVVKALDVVLSDSQYKGKNRKYPKSNLNRETFVVLSIMRDKYEAGTLPEDERVVYEFVQTLRKRCGSGRARLGRTAVANWVFETLHAAIKEFASKHPEAAKNLFPKTNK
jgi:hypothetical protein